VSHNWSGSCGDKENRIPVVHFVATHFTELIIAIPSYRFVYSVFRKPLYSRYVVATLQHAETGKFIFVQVGDTDL
jgi:F0F1-type ATP synthase assembly protein I